MGSKSFFTTRYFDNLKMKYCISCEKMVMVNERNWHGVYVPGSIGYFYECEGPVVEAGPMELEDNWQDLLDEPSAEELAQMDANAEELLLSIGE